MDKEYEVKHTDEATARAKADKTMKDLEAKGYKVSVKKTVVYTYRVRAER